MKATRGELQVDHHYWQSDIKHWRDDVQRWKEEQEALLNALSKALNEHLQALKEHGEQIGHHQAAVIAHEHFLLECEHTAGTELQDEEHSREDAHGLEARRQAALWDAHERIKKHHHGIIAKIEMLNAAIGHEL